MSVTKDAKTNKWMSQIRITDWAGKTVHKKKRGFSTKKEALQWEHDIRHSHASLLVEMGFSPLLIAERLGHERIQTTLETYSHLYPNKQVEVAKQLDNLIL